MRIKMYKIINDTEYSTQRELHANILYAPTPSLSNKRKIKKKL